MRADRKDEFYVPPLPETDAQYLIDFLFEVGPTSLNAIGEGPLSHMDLAAWQENVGFRLQVWEARFLRLLSFEYLLQAQEATEPNCAAPWTAEDMVPDRRLIAKSMQRSMRALAE